MDMNVTLKSAEHHRQTVENLFHYYVYDLAEFGKWPCGKDGRYGFNSSLLDPHWSREDHWPYLVYQGDELAGFCLLRRYPHNPERYDIDQFFIVRKFRGIGVAKEAIRILVANRPGLWQTRVMLENTSALQFWRAVIASVCSGPVQEQILPDYDLDMYFIKYEIA